MRNEKQPTTELDSMGRLAIAVAKASELCHPSARKTLLEACDALEEEFDSLKVEVKAIENAFLASQHLVARLKAERDALQAKYDRIINAEVTKTAKGLSNLERAMLIGLQQESIERMKAETVVLKGGE